MSLPAATSETMPARDFRVADYLLAAAPQVPLELVSASAQQDINALAASLPGAITSFCGYECELGVDEAAADFLLCSTREEGHVAVLAGARADLDLPAALRAHPGWQGVSGFCQAWLEPHSPLDPGLMNIWLEFDVTRDTQAVTRPSLFFGTHVPAPDAPVSTQGALLEAALRLLDPAAVEGARGLALQRCLAALPLGSHIFQIGVMWSRASAATRLCVRGINAAQLGATLAALAWPGPRAPLEALLAQLAALTVRLDIDIDVGADGVADKLGIECYFGTDLDTSERLRRMNDYLLDAGLCTAPKAAALLRYGGLSHQDAPAQSWPVHLSALAAQQGDDVASCMLRWVHHIKIVCQAGHAVQAKAYLALEHHLFDRQHLKAVIAATRAPRRT